MLTVHRELAVAIVLAALGGSIWAGYAAYRLRWSTRLALLGSLTTVAIALQALFGVLLAAGGQRPQDPLHFVFGPATLLALPLARLAGRTGSDRAAGLLVCAGWLATLALSLRATGTGGLG